MKDFRFYLEYPNKKEKRKATRKMLGNHTGNCLAVFTNVKEHLLPDLKSIETIAAVYFHANSDCCLSSASFDYIQKKCKRISEQQAREIHPKLFSYLEQ